MDFNSQTVTYLTAFQADMQRDFHLIPNAEYNNRRFPLYAIYENEDTTTLIMKGGKSVRSYEFCYFDCCELLDADALQGYCAVLDDMAARYVPWDQSSHGFSMLSMVVLTNGAPDRTVCRQLRRYKHEETRKKDGEYGWCSGRLCVVDVTTGSCWVNSHGSALANRIKATVKKVSGR